MTSAVQEKGRQVLSTPDRIVETATHMFLQLGYGATSMSALAKGCGVQKASLYHHFESKEAVLFACFQSGYSETVERMRLVLHDRDRPHAERLDLMIDEIYNAIVHSAAGRMAPVIAETTGRVPEIAQRFNDEFMEEMHRIILQFLSEGMEAGAFARFDLDAMDHAVFGIPVNLTLCRSMFVSIDELQERMEVETVKAHHMTILRTLLQLPA